ncbi:MAG TPA: hypothetical protein VFF42_04015, partial [Candidatus Eremiobacteraceae bacterium]|nr:hypothetical protein [Candidatus Eremiobacteraceae bacterium]
GVQNWSYEQAKAYLDTANEPTLLVLSKADNFDQNSAWSTLVQQQHPEKIAKLHAFAIYEWQPKKVARTSPLPSPAS